MSIVKVTVTHSCSSIVVPEKRLALTQTIRQLKIALASHFPTPPDHMLLQLFNEKGVEVESNMQDEKMLGYYQCRDDFSIHVVDQQPASSVAVDEFSDVSKVKKFEISEDAYAKRQQTGREFREKMQAKQREQMIKEGLPLPTEVNDDSYKEAAAAIPVGSRCKCRPGDRLGAVKFVGRVSGLKPGFWIGVEFDEPVGKEDGTVLGVKIFDCRPLYCSFLRPEQVEVGDFPPEEF